MRVPTKTNDGVSKIKHVAIEKPIIIPRYPVITNGKQREKLIKTIERMVRSSMEYKDYIAFLKEKMDMTQCAYFHNVGGKQKRGFIEIHHEPFNLYTLTDIVITKQEQEKGYISELEVAEEVMYLHYTNRVGLIPLSVTVHELVHAGKIIIPLDCVYGNFVKFTRDYFEYISDGTKELIKEKIELTKKLDPGSPEVLDVNYVYLDVDGFRLPELIDESELKE